MVNQYYRNLAFSKKTKAKVTKAKKPKNQNAESALSKFGFFRKNEKAKVAKAKKTKNKIVNQHYRNLVFSKKRKS